MRRFRKILRDAEKANRHFFRNGAVTPSQKSDHAIEYQIEVWKEKKKAGSKKGIYMKKLS